MSDNICHSRQHDPILSLKILSGANFVLYPSVIKFTLGQVSFLTCHISIPLVKNANFLVTNGCNDEIATF